MFKLVLTSLKLTRLNEEQEDVDEDDEGERARGRRAATGQQQDDAQRAGSAAAVTLKIDFCLLRRRAFFLKQQLATSFLA